MQVFLTFDTEIWPFVRDWPETPLPHPDYDFTREVDAYIWGDTGADRCGLPYQFDVLNRHGLNATYFVESLCADVVGAQTLRQIVGSVQDAGHEVQLHAHTEWLGETARHGLPRGFRQHMRHYSQCEQTRIIARAVDNLRTAGGRRLCAFRAGNFGADRATLRALASNGIAIDSSHNAWAGEPNGWIAEPRHLGLGIEGVREYSVATFRDFPGHLRPAHLNACSHDELKHALLAAWRLGWQHFVIVGHSFDFIKRPQRQPRPLPDPVNRRRFEALCAFLDGHREQFRTMLFSQVAGQAEAVSEGDAAPIRSPLRFTVARVAQQIAGRLT